jgi:aspartate-semialdehyde dehydrogenase
MKKNKTKKVVAVVGATGAVGAEMLKVLERRRFPIAALIPLASERSEGKTVTFKKKKIKVCRLTEESFKGVDIALFSAGSSVSQHYAPIAAKSGAVVIDNTSAFRMDPSVPLVVPEINPEDLKRHRGIIANPNCSTIQMVLVLKPIHEKFKIKRVVVSTYQSVSGAGQQAINALLNESMAKLSGSKVKERVMHHPIAFNVIPQIDLFLADGYTKEELKMMNETKKILHDDSFKLTSTCVRVPVLRGHSEAVNIETEKPFTISEIKKALSTMKNLVIVDKPEERLYPMPIDAEGRFDTFVGRIRKDNTVPHGLNCWIVSDNLLKGAAFNAVQIAELL